jgi:hypothetical protein
VNHDELKASILAAAEGLTGSLHDERARSKSPESLTKARAERVWREVAGDLDNGDSPLLEKALAAVSQGLQPPRTEDELRSRLHAADQLVTTVRLQARVSDAEAQLWDADREANLADVLDQLDLDLDSAYQSAKQLMEDGDMGGLQEFWSEWNARDPFAASYWLDQTRQREESKALLEEGIAAIKAREEELEHAEEIGGAIASRWETLAAERAEPALAQEIAGRLFANPDAIPSSPEEAEEAMDAVWRTADSISVAQQHAAIKQGILDEGLGHNIAHALSVEEVPTVTPQVDPRSILPPPDIEEDVKSGVMGEYEKSQSFTDEVEKVAARAVARAKAEER